MNKEASIKIQKLIESKIDVPEFESWLYSVDESSIEPDIYEELILINYSEKSASKEVEKLIEKKEIIGELHREYLIDLIKNIVDKSLHPMKGLDELNNWAVYRGYIFLGRLKIIGNFSEQGKSAVYLFSNEDNSATAWNKISAHHPQFFKNLSKISSKLRSGKIQLTGKWKPIKHYGRFYEFNEKTGFFNGLFGI